jgi:hypothetical protein
LRGSGLSVRGASLPRPYLPFMMIAQGESEGEHFLVVTGLIYEGVGL